MRTLKAAASGICLIANLAVIRSAERARILNRKHRGCEKLNNAPLGPRLAAAGQINKSHMPSRSWRFEK